MGLELFFEAFMELHTCRGGMNDGPIPWTAVDQYCTRHGFSDDLYEDVLYHVRAVDDAWRDHVLKKPEPEKHGKAVRKSRV